MEALHEHHEVWINQPAHHPLDLHGKSVPNDVPSDLKVHWTIAADAGSDMHGMQSTVRPTLVLEYDDIDIDRDMCAKREISDKLHKFWEWVAQRGN